MRYFLMVRATGASIAFAWVAAMHDGAAADAARQLVAETKDAEILGAARGPS